MQPLTNRDTVRLTIEGYTAAVPAKLFQGLEPAEEERLGIAIINSQRELALELASYQKNFVKVYSGLGETPFSRMANAVLGARAVDDDVIEDADVFLSRPSAERQFFLDAIDSLDRKLRFRADFLLQLINEFNGEAPSQVRILFDRWRLCVNRLVEYFYPAALKSYWESKRISKGHSDDSFSDAMMLVIKCAERFNPANGSFISFYTTYQRYAAIHRDKAYRQELLEVDAEWILNQGSCDDEPTASLDPCQLAENESQKRYVHKLIRQLTTNERLVVDNSFGIGNHSITQRDFAKNMDLTPGRISQLKRSALASLKRTIENENSSVIIGNNFDARGHQL